MGRGIHRGFITHDELNKSLGKRNLSGENLALAFLHILDEKISLVEKKSDFKALKKRDSANKDEPKTDDKTNDATTTPTTETKTTKKNNQMPNEDWKKGQDKAKDMGTDLDALVKKRKGIILAGGVGSRLTPLTLATSKQLLPIYDKPMIYYPLTTLMMSGVKEILIICRKDHLESFKKLIGDGNNWGLSIEYACQKNPRGIAEAFLIAEEFLEDSPCVLILGDNLFYGNNLISQLQNANTNEGATIFVYPVSEPSRYGIVNFNKNKKAINIEEKPKNPSSNFAVTGIYFFDNNVINFAKELKPSSRGELEITDINQKYLDKNNLNIQFLGRGMAWLDTGTFDALQEAGSFIRTIEKRQGLKVGCPEEIAWRSGLINDIQLRKLAKNQKNEEYSKYLNNLLLNFK